MAKYDFKGIKKWGAKGITVALASTGWGTWLTTTPIIRRIVEIVLERVVNWAANKGLIILNIGVIYIEGEFDQKAFDKALEEGIKKAEVGGLSEAEGRKIDEQVREAARKFIVFTRS